MKAEEIIDTIEFVAPLFAASSWDYSGIQCISTNNSITRMAVCLDATLSVVEAAIAKGAQFILAHHPLALHPELPNKLDDYYHILSLLIKNNVWLYSAHTSLDVNCDGPVNYLAKELKLENLEILDPIVIEKKDDRRFGFGLVGNLPQITSCKNIISKLGNILNLDSLALCGNINDNYQNITVSRIAYCPGSGGNLIGRAQKLGSDLYITGDIKYHSALDAKIPVIDVGHHSMEEKMMEIFCKYLINKLSQLNIFFIPSKSPMRTIFLKSQENNYE